ncbi:3707_t:CDS:10 [Entrophospora sp. SA101]|nr:13077_t:CDS:10 [Entrophospora sp. SA101]CAJ0755758.1 3707_t:CDS:10 [Entrophospora sp. SA101]CAJ0843495.1 4694_t:CDS:10 [Entrophospora sp. SA101]
MNIELLKLFNYSAIRRSSQAIITNRIFPLFSQVINTNNYTTTTITEVEMEIAANMNVEDYNVITEGKASILFPKNNEVFYNNVQQFNRDMSIAAIRTWNEIISEEKETKLRKKEKKGNNSSVEKALSASGLRSIRYAKEIPNIQYIIANDLELDAVNSIIRNVEYNNVDKDLVRANQDDACAVLYQHRSHSNRFDVIDIDPYGTAAPFLDGAVQAVQNGGLLCITCTDLAILTGSNYPEKCYANYGSIPIRGEHCHEMALRILINTIATSAARYHRQIVPVLSCSIDFYIRVFIRVFSSPLEVGGPIWNHSIHDKDFVLKMLDHVKSSNEETYKTHARMLGMLTELDSPLYHSIPVLSGVIHCISPPLKTVCSGILNKGYKVSASHAAANAIKTDAPMSLIWDVMKSWVKLNPVTAKNIAENSPSKKILSVEPSFIADFNTHKDVEPPSRKIKLVRYQQNPEKNWGPKPRALGKRKINDVTKNDNENNSTKKLNLEVETSSSTIKDENV